jgi:hypothetical protein
MLVLAGCGNNAAGPGLDFTLEPPAAIRAYAVDSAHVRIHWDASKSASDPTFGGYIISWGTFNDTLSAAVLRYTAGPLPPGLTQFSLRSRRTDGRTSPTISLAWAPAYRFDTAPLVIYEIDDSTGGQPTGVDAGTQSTNPAAIVINPLAQARLDFFLQGHAGQPLLLSSANQYNSLWNGTVFSTESVVAPSLDTASAAFPASSTFSLLNVPVQDNTIYYAQVLGDAGQVNYIRFLVRVLAGSFPNRSIEIRISLQRAAGVPIAGAVPAARHTADRFNHMVS